MGECGIPLSASGGLPLDSLKNRGVEGREGKKGRGGEHEPFENVIPCGELYVIPVKYLKKLMSHKYPRLKRLHGKGVLKCNMEEIIEWRKPGFRTNPPDTRGARELPPQTPIQAAGGSRCDR